MSSDATVLFVDDEPGILATMRMLFRGRYKLLFANSGAEALEMIRAQHVDVIVSDQRMPNMMGVELLKAVRTASENTMRILLTGYSDLNSIVGSINEGEIFRFVNKPWENDELLSSVAMAVEAARISAKFIPPAIVDDQSGENATGILVMDDDPMMAEKIQAILGTSYKVLGVTTLGAAVDHLENEDVSVVITETRLEATPITSMLGRLKETKPELVSVILTDRADAHSAIDLINQGQIFRMIGKPVHDSQCRIAVKSAVRQHQKLAQAPELHKRYEVAASKEPPPVRMNEGLLNRIRSFRSRARTVA